MIALIPSLLARVFGSWMFLLLAAWLAPLPAQTPAPPPHSAGGVSVIFGPATFAASPGTVAVHQVSLATPEAGPDVGAAEVDAVMIILNGVSGEGGAGVESMHRVTSGSLALDGRTVALIGADTDRLIVPVRLRDGRGDLVARLEGGALASVTVAVQARIEGATGATPVFTPAITTAAPEPTINAGVLELAYGSIAPPLVLEFCLKNKSHVHPRTVRLACITADGRFSDVSPVFEIRPNGTLTIRLPGAGLEKPRNAGQDIAPEPWREGSVNVIWVGRGPGAVTGYAISGMKEPGAGGNGGGPLRERVVLPLVPQP